MVTPDMLRANSMVSNTSNDTLVDNDQKTVLAKHAAEQLSYEDDELDDEEHLLLPSADSERRLPIWRKALASCKVPNGITIGLCGLLLILVSSILHSPFRAISSHGISASVSCHRTRGGLG